MPRKSIFSNLKDAKIRVDANYIRGGHYYMLIDRCKTDQNRNNLDFAVVEMTCVHVLDSNNGNGHKPGESPSWLIMASNDFFASDILTFICNVMGMDADDLNETERIEAAEMVFGDVSDKDHGQPLAGTTVEVKAREVAKKEGEGTFTKVSFVREVKATELLDRLTEEEQAKFYPNDVLTEMAESED